MRKDAKSNHKSSTDQLNELYKAYEEEFESLQAKGKKLIEKYKALKDSGKRSV